MSNYWVDVVYVSADEVLSTAPTVITRVPADGAAGVTPTANVTAEFSEAINPATVTASNFVLRVASTGAAVAAAVTYDAGTRVATLNPTAALVAGTTYTVTLRGGAAGIRDLSGEALVRDVTWIFTTRTTTGFTIWPATAIPATIDKTGDLDPVELGVKFRRRAMAPSAASASTDPRPTSALTR